MDACKYLTKLGGKGLLIKVNFVTSILYKGEKQF